jgi:hypothetical protein
MKAPAPCSGYLGGMMGTSIVLLPLSESRIGVCPQIYALLRLPVLPRY